ncbi:hypothetical protein BDF22DRAFT_172601 [Syncephalis plumigaleata]|nr:hypothetical protein BDF22DRAFT_172601 [Syncephalis plumigaleata]
MTAKQEDEGEDAENEEAPIGRSLRNRNRRSYVEPSEADLDAALVSDDTFDNFNATTTATTTSLNGRTQNIHANTDYTNDDHDDAFMNDYFSNSGTINRKESQRRTGLSQTNDSSLNTSHVETSHSLDANHDDDDDDDGDNQGRTRRSRRIQSRQRAHSDEDGDGSYMPMDEDSHHDDSQGSNLDVDDNDDSDMDYGRPRRRTSTRDHMSNNNNNGGGGNTNTTGGKSTSALHSTMSLRTRRAVGSGSIQSANYHDNGSVNRGMRSGAASKTTTTATTATTATARPARNMPARATKRGFLDRLRETAGMLDTYRNEDDMKNVEKYVPTGRSGLRQRNRVDYQRLDNGQPVPPSVSAQSHHHLNHLDHDHHHDTEEDEDGLNGTPRKYRLRARAAPKNYDEVSYFNSMLNRICVRPSRIIIIDVVMAGLIRVISVDHP